MDIPDPRRILAVSLDGSESHLSRVLKGTQFIIPFPFHVLRTVFLGGVRLFIDEVLLQFFGVEESMRIFKTDSSSLPLSEKKIHILYIKLIFLSNIGLDELCTFIIIVRKSYANLA